MKTNTLADNRALFHVLSLSENTEQTPSDILRSAVAGGVVGAFEDEKGRYVDTTFLPSARDLTALAIFITEEICFPFFCSAVGSGLPRHTTMTKTGCFEPLSLPVILFPDCFSMSPSLDNTLQNTSTLSLSPCRGSARSASLDGYSVVPAAVHPAVTEVVDVLQLHQQRMYLGVLLLKSVNEVLREAEIWKQKASREKTKAKASGLAPINAVIALFSEVKILLLCCIVSANKAYTMNEENNNRDCDSLDIGGEEEVGSHADFHNKTAQNYFQELFPPEELLRIFNHKSRSTAEDVTKRYDAMMKILVGNVPEADSELQMYINGLQRSLEENSRRITGTPMQLLHRSCDAASATMIHIPCVHPAIPSLEIQPGELTCMLFDNVGGSLVFDVEPSKLCLLLRRSASVKLTPTQLRDAEKQITNSPWCELSDAVVELVQLYLSNDELLSCILEKNSAFLAKLVQWLRETPQSEDPNRQVVESKEVGPEVKEKEKIDLGNSMASNIINHVIHLSSFSTAVAQFIREVLNAGEMCGAQFYAWVERSVTELENKPSATIGLFALVVTFGLAHRGWDLPEPTRETVMTVCMQHKQQSNCVTLFNLLCRHS